MCYPLEQGTACVRPCWCRCRYHCDSDSSQWPGPHMGRSELTAATSAANLRSVTMHRLFTLLAVAPPSQPPHSLHHPQFVLHIFLFVSLTKRSDLLLNSIGFVSLIKCLGILIVRDASSQQCQHNDRWCLRVSADDATNNTAADDARQATHVRCFCQLNAALTG